MVKVKVSEEQLLALPQVVDEINRHLWCESEKAGKNIGFENAKKDWLKKYSQGWIAYHKPEWIEPEKKNGTSDAVKATAAKKRRAKSYLI